METEIKTLLTEIIVTPLIKELATRRGVHGVTPENLEAFKANPKQILKNLQQNVGLQKKVVIDLADALDNMAGDAVDALISVFAANTPGGEIEANE